MYQCFLILITIIFYFSLAQKARLEPLFDQVINAAGQCSTNGQATYEGCEGILGYSQYLNQTKPFALMVYFSITDPKQTVFNNLGILQQLLLKDPHYQPAGTTVGFQVGLWFADACTGCPYVPRDEQVANGSYDDSIDAMIQAFSDCVNFPLFCNSPIWLRIGYEFNGEWNMYNPVPYQQAYKRITQKLRANPHTNKYVATVWDYSADAEEDRLDYLRWYPGDEWVDWWGVNIFSDRDGHAGPGDGNVLKFLTDASARGIPVLLGECTPRGYPVTQGQATWDGWFKPYFDLIHNPKFTIKFASYINWDWDQSQWKWGNAEIEVNPVIGGLYQQEMKRINQDNLLAWLHLGPSASIPTKINLNGGKN